MTVTNQTLNPGQALALDRPVSEIYVSVGEIEVRPFSENESRSFPDNVGTYEAEETCEPGESPCTIYAPIAAAVRITYA